jgi:hypothetical protein
MLHRVVALLIEAAGASETSVNFYQTTPRNNPGDGRLQSDRTHCEKERWSRQDVVIWALSQLLRPFIYFEYGMPMRGKAVQVQSTCPLERYTCGGMAVDSCVSSCDLYVPTNPIVQSVHVFQDCVIRNRWRLLKISLPPMVLSASCLKVHHGQICLKLIGPHVTCRRVSKDHLSFRSFPHFESQYYGGHTSLTSVMFSQFKLLSVTGTKHPNSIFIFSACVAHPADRHGARHGVELRGVKWVARDKINLCRHQDKLK